MKSTDSSPSASGSSWSRRIPASILIVSLIGVGIALFRGSPEALPAGAPLFDAQVLRTLPHDRTAFSQGLVMYEGQLIESCGQYGESRLQRINPQTGQITASVKMPSNVFAEGITVWNDEILQLTWREGRLLRYDARTLAYVGAVSYRQIDSRLREGWGITHDGENLIISDGTPVLRFVDPNTFRTVRRLRVRAGGIAVEDLNELEYVDGKILANVWYRDQIARIDPETGRVTAWLQLKTLRPASVRGNREAALNGIAVDPKQNVLYVTGKNWPSMFVLKWDDSPAATVPTN